MKVFTIIVTYNAQKWIKKCIESVLISDIPSQIVLVDNNSSDETIAFVSHNFPSVIIIENKINLGFGKANNIGISFALKNNADYIFLLNQDAYIHTSTLKELVNLSIQYPKYGIISPIQYNYEGNDLEPYFKTFIKHSAAIDLFSHVVLKKEISRLYEVPFIQAAVWLLPVNTIREVGGFDPIFFHYGEDDNFCQRIKYHNYLIGIAPHVSAFHYGTKVDQTKVVKFSEMYFQNLEKNLKVKYANINVEFNDSTIRMIKKQTLKLIFKNFITLNFHYVKGYRKEFIQLKLIFKTIMQSRKINSNKYHHYLEI